MQSFAKIGLASRCFSSPLNIWFVLRRIFREYMQGRNKYVRALKAIYYSESMTSTLSIGKRLVVLRILKKNCQKTIATKNLDLKNMKCRCVKRYCMN